MDNIKQENQRRNFTSVAIAEAVIHFPEDSDCKQDGDIHNRCLFSEMLSLFTIK